MIYKRNLQTVKQKRKTLFQPKKQINRTTLNKELEDLYRRIKLKSHFRKPENKVFFTENDIFRKPTNKTWVPINNYNNIATFIEATQNKINNENEKMKRPHIQTYL